ncbi:cardiolipin synthase [Natranaerofaba carboxydovora]|uniref:cardiolipin synthase n=1 Tax=Natranaerofaba carboxydovora TaxID=2742683 RepID=UPI001F133F45|nr:cardiolipin synthase [Natranaerofaba carboxydovora]UMZ73789.1 Major cardiolipin synthase ClsA [Natranaerofaba carboxydovora]
MLVMFIIIKIILIVSVLFIEKKPPMEAIAWILLIVFFPIGGYILYILFGETWTKKLAKQGNEKYLKENYESHLHDRIRKNAPGTNPTPIAKLAPEGFDNFHSLLQLHKNHSNSTYTLDNNVKIFTCGEDKFKQLFEDIENSAQSIHILYFRIYKDDISTEFVNRLTRKAKQGVEVRLIYDGVASFTSKSFFKDLINAGGKVYADERSFLKNLFKINFRNHRKLAVIDGQIGYIGGMNVSDRYMGKHKKKNPWRDTHLRVTGSAVLSLQFYFIRDWSRIVPSLLNDIPKSEIEEYLPLPKEKGNIGMQIVISGVGPEEERVKLGFINMITHATEEIQIQTPYFVPDQEILQALKVAILSGVRVQIMVPGISSSMFLHPVTLSYAKELLMEGAEVYLYKGYIHAKTISVDKKVCSIGSTNFDQRSLNLSDEINAFVYDSDFARYHKEIFNEDIKNSIKIRKEDYENQDKTTKFMDAVRESTLRLIAPFL